MSLKLLELLKEISDAQVDAARNRDFHALGLLHQSRQDLMLSFDGGVGPSLDENKIRAQELLDGIFENEKHIRVECQTSHGVPLDAAWI